MKHPPKFFGPSFGHNGAGQLDEIDALVCIFFDDINIVFGNIVNPENHPIFEVMECGDFR